MPLVLNIVISSLIIFRSKISNVWTITILFIGIPKLLFHGLIVLWLDNDYSEIVNPDTQQSIVIEY